MTNNGSTEGGWVGTLAITVTLSDSAKAVLEAIAVLGSFSASDGYPDEIDSLEEHEFVRCERQGETYTRNGRSRRDGIDVYRLTELGERWLKNCKRAGQAKMAGSYPDDDAAENREALLR